jgi:hypothetical protein
VGTIFIHKNKDTAVTCTEFAQSKTRNPDRRVRFPVTVEFYDQRAKIYAPAKNFPFYRVAFKVAGKRRMLTFGSYGEAKAAAEKKVKELHKGQQSSALTAKQAQDALTVRDMLAAYRQETGKVISIVELTGNYLSAVKQLPNGCSLLEAVRVYRQSILAVQRKPLAEAVREFCDARSPTSNKSFGPNGSALWPECPVSIAVCAATPHTFIPENQSSHALHRDYHLEILSVISALMKSRTSFM